MISFQYSALDKEGQRISATALAESPSALVSRLKHQGFTPLKVSRAKAEQSTAKSVGSFLHHRKVTGREVVVFTRQLSTILRAGVILTEALEAVASDVENEQLLRTIESVLADIRAGDALSVALAHYPAVFSAYYVAVTRSGEESGTLSKTMEDLAKYLEEYERMREKFVSATRYPLFLMCFVAFIVSVIVLFLIPKFSALFLHAGAQLPLLTRIVVGISEFCIHNFFWMLLALALIVVAAWRLLQIFRIRFMFDYQSLRLPLIGDIIRKATVARFCRTASMLLSGGVGLIQSLALAAEVSSNVYLRHIMDEVRRSVSTGSSLSEALRPHAAIPRVVVKMVAVGEKSGSVDEMLKCTAEYYDQEVDGFLNNLTAILEPIFIIIIGGIVLIVALALYLPIFHISSAVR